MSIIFADGFDDWAAANFAQEGFSYASGNNSNQAYSIAAGRRAGSTALRSVMTVGGNNSLAPYNYYLRGLGANYSSLYVHFAMKYDTRPNSNQSIFEFGEAGQATHLTLLSNSGGTLVVNRGAGNGTTLGSSSQILGLGTWYSVEMFFTVHDTTGSVELRINGTTVLNLSNVDTRNGGAAGVINQMTIGFTATNTSALLQGHVWNMDDLVIYDSTGSICNTWTGDIRVDPKPATAAGDLTQLTPSAGDNWECVDDASGNITDYVSSSVAGQADLYQVQDLSHTPTAIYGVYATALCTKDDAGARQVKLKIKSGSSTADSAALSPTNGSWLRLAALFETDPATGVAWTKTGWNAAQTGEEVV
jgi:hypothetical protein